MIKWFKIVLLFSFFGAAQACAQVGLQYAQPSLSLDLSDFKINTLSIYNQLSFSPLNLAIPNSTKILYQNNPVKPFPQVYNFHELAIFCKIEVKLEKAAKFPVKFRLGDVQYVDQLEGK